MIDFHIHSNTSLDNKNLIREIYKTAEEKGLRCICITNHHEFRDTSSYGLTLSEEQIRECREEISGLHGKTQALFGVEMGYDESSEEDIRSFLRKNKFDFVIGSVHFVEGLAVSDSKNRGRFSPAALDEYFRLLKKAIAFGEFDVIGHIDVFVKTLRHPDFEALKPRWEEVADLLLRHKTGFEVNTSRGLQVADSFYPHPKVIELFVQKGIRTITYGSDSHSYDRIGHNYDKVVALLRSLGVDQLCLFTKRKPSFIDM